jgi:4-amino-4-deoxy-L-arabinose transferase-like glycosyltransferase
MMNADSTLWTRRFWLLLAAAVLFRGLFTLFFTEYTDLAGDEAYYWDWGRRPDWGYYSKPPLIGWLMGFIGQATGHSELGIRLTALLLSTLTCVTLFSLTQRLYNARTAFIAASLLLLTPASAALSLFLTIDAPLLLCWSLALLLFHHAAEQPQSWVRWLALTAVLGVGTLSKQMMLVFPVIMLAQVLLGGQSRTLLCAPGFWLSMVTGAAFLTPVLWWNSQHQWITLEHTKHHFNAESLGVGGWLLRTLEWPGVQALVYTPVLWLAMLVVGVLAWRQWRQLAQRERFLFIASVPILAIFTLLALRQRINPNWPAVFYVPLLILLAAYLSGALPGLKRAPGWWRWCWRSAAVILAVVHVGLAVVFLTDLKGHKKLADLRGWRETGEQAGGFYQKLPPGAFVLALGHRYHAAQMAFYMPQHPQSYRYEPSGHVMSQYEVWAGPEERLGQDALILNDRGGELPPAVREAFTEIRPLGKIEVPLGQKTRTWQAYHGVNLKSWKAVK